MRQRSHYEVLQVREDASPKVIVAAWRALDRQLEQPAAGEAAQSEGLRLRREQVARAATVLLDPVERARYDAEALAGRAQAWEDPAASMAAGGWNPGRPQTARPAPVGRVTVVGLGLAWLLFFAVLFFGFDRYLEFRENPNRNLAVMAPAEEEILLKRSRSGHYIVPGLINGQPVSFLIDTGATQVSIPAELAGALKLRPGAPSRALTANGAVEVRQTRVAQLNLGPFAFRNVAAHLNPGMTGNKILLGMSVLSHLDFEQSNGHLSLRMP